MNDSINSQIAKDKLMILYIIKKSNSTMTYNQLSNFILEYNLINYFSFVEYYNELSSSNFLEKSSKPELILTDFSYQTLELLEENIDDDIKNKIDNIFSDNNYSSKSDEFQIIPLDNKNYLINLSINGNLDPEFKLSFTIDDFNEGKKIERNWTNKNKSLYRQILKIIREAK